MIVPEKIKESTTDLYFVGAGKSNRLKILHDIYGYFGKNGGSMLFRVTQVSKADRKYEGIKYNQPVNYRVALGETLNSNCILEISVPGQVGATLRYNEAVCYNKKLLTNNKKIVELPFYNPNYMHIYENPKDIDWDWVKERAEVDYGYDGQFSPSRLIDKILELETEKGKIENC